MGEINSHLGFFLHIICVCLNQLSVVKQIKEPAEEEKVKVTETRMGRGRWQGNAIKGQRQKRAKRGTSPWQAPPPSPG